MNPSTQLFLNLQERLVCFISTILRSVHSQVPKLSSCLAAWACFLASHPYLSHEENGGRKSPQETQMKWMWRVDDEYHLNMMSVKNSQNKKTNQFYPLFLSSNRGNNYGRVLNRPTLPQKVGHKLIVSLSTWMTNDPYRCCYSCNNLSRKHFVAVLSCHCWYQKRHKYQVPRWVPPHLHLNVLLLPYTSVWDLGDQIFLPTLPSLNTDLLDSPTVWNPVGFASNGSLLLWIRAVFQSAHLRYRTSVAFQ